MAVKIGNIAKYTPVPAGKAINLRGEEKRKVRVEVNCEYETRFDVVQGGNVYFLGRVVGHDTVEFIVDGPAVLQPTSVGEVWLCTDEGPHLVYESDEPSFVTLDFERQELSHFEKLQAIANLKREQREQETEALLEELRAERQALEEARNGQVAGDDNNGEQGADASAGAGEPEPEGEGEAGQSGAASGVQRSAKSAK